MNATLRMLALIGLMALSACANKRPLELPGHEKHHPPKHATEPQDESSDDDTITPETLRGSKARTPSTKGTDN